VAHVPRVYFPGHFGIGPLVVTGEPAQRLASVMRVREGDPLLLFPGDGHEWHATVAAVSRSSVRVDILGLARQAPLPALSIEIWCAIVRPGRFDWMLEKVTEAGADVIRPLLCDHSARGEGGSAARRERWERIIIEASEQCGRLYIPVITEPARFAEIVSHLRSPLVLAHMEDAREWRETAALLPDHGSLAVAVGPEGGFSPAEVAAARAHGALATLLGPNILRSETAALAATVLLRA
jgi:16S rRNA (uracil1498-N3)-methyltransferase